MIKTAGNERTNKTTPHRFVGAAFEGGERPQSVRLQERELVRAEKFHHSRVSVVALRPLGLKERKSNIKRSCNRASENDEEGCERTKMDG